MIHAKALIAGVLAGIAAPASIGGRVEYPRLSGSDLTRMRSDVQRVGRDFSRVITKQNGEKSSEIGRKAA